MISPNRHGEMNVKPAKGTLEIELESEDEYGMHRAEESHDIDWSHDPRSEASLEDHDKNSGTKKSLSDEELKEKVISALALREDLRVEDEEIKVSSGIVTIKGLVPDREQKVQVERMIESIGSVSDIYNQLQIRSTE